MELQFGLPKQSVVDIDESMEKSYRRRDEQSIDCWRRYDLGQFANRLTAFGHFGEHSVDSIFCARGIYMQPAHCLHCRRSQKKTIFDLKPGRIDQIRSHIASLPGCRAFASKPSLALAAEAPVKIQDYCDAAGARVAEGAEDQEK